MSGNNRELQNVVKVDTYFFFQKIRNWKSIGSFLNSAAAWLKKQISIVISAALNSRAIFQSNRLKKSQTSAIQALAQIQILRGNSAEIGVWPNFRATRIDFGKFFRSF